MQIQMVFEFSIRFCFFVYVCNVCVLASVINTAPLGIPWGRHMCIKHNILKDRNACSSTCIVSDWIKVKSLFLQTLCNKWHLIFHKPSKMCYIEASIGKECKSLVQILCIDCYYCAFAAKQSETNEIRTIQAKKFSHFNVCIVFGLIRICCSECVLLTCVRLCISHQYYVHWWASTWAHLKSKTIDFCTHIHRHRSINVAIQPFNNKKNRVFAMAIAI